MQKKTYTFVIQNSKASQLSKIFVGIVAFRAVAMATESGFHFELKHFGLAQPHHCINRKESGAKISV